MTWVSGSTELRSPIPPTLAACGFLANGAGVTRLQPAPQEPRAKSRSAFRSIHHRSKRQLTIDQDTKSIVFCVFCPQV